MGSLYATKKKQMLKSGSTNQQLFSFLLVFFLRVLELRIQTLTGLPHLLFFLLIHTILERQNNRT